MPNKVVTLISPVDPDQILITPLNGTQITVETTASGVSADGTLRETGVVTLQFQRDNPQVAALLTFLMNQWRLAKGY